MAVENEDKSWIAELESALNEDCIRQDDNYDDIYDGQILSESLRPEMWKSLLVVRDPDSYFDDIFDLPEQKILRKDCQEFVAKLGNEEEDKVSVLSDLESILTAHRRSCGQEYQSNNGWIDLLKPLIPLKLPRVETYSLFQSIVNKYCPRHQSVYHLFRLLILYHDPKLCSFIDTKRVTPESYTSSWFQSMFASICCLPAVSALWDLHFQQGDPFFILFLGLVLLLNAREEIMKLKDEDKQSVIDFLSNIPRSLDVGDIHDLCSLAQYYSNRTPGSFRQDVENVIFDDVDYSSLPGLPVEQALCLPVSVRELLDSLTVPPLMEYDQQVRFFLVDCRPPDQYNAGHLPTAFHLDPNLMLQGGEAFSTAVQGLLSSQSQALAANSKAGGDHLCFMGCGGSVADDQFTHMIVASFLHSNTHYVTMLTGGYTALHEYLSDCVEGVLADHNSAACVVCLKERSEEQQSSPNVSQSPSKDILGKIGAAVKLKSAEVKEKLLEYIVNPGGSDSERHVSSRDKARKRYRNMAPVFSIDDNDIDTLEGEGEHKSPEVESLYEVVSLSSWLKKPEMVATFSCEELKMNGESYKSHLLVSSSHVYVLRCESRDTAKVVTRRPLLSIAKITCKKRHPTLITFKYSTPHGESQVISDMDRFLIPKAKDATSVISSQIVKLLENSDSPPSPSPQEQKE